MHYKSVPGTGRPAYRYLVPGTCYLVLYKYRYHGPTGSLEQVIFIVGPTLLYRTVRYGRGVRSLAARPLELCSHLIEQLGLKPPSLFRSDSPSV